MSATLLLTLQVVIYQLTALPAPGGFVDAEFKRREASVEDVARFLGKDRGLEMGPSALRLTVVSSALEETGAMRMETREILGGQQSDSKPRVMPTVRVRLQLGDYTKDFVGMNRGALPTWTSAAEDVARQIRTWVTDNREKVCRETGNCS